MGGDSSFPWISSAEDDSSLGLDYQHQSIKSPLSSDVAECSSSKLENGYESSLGVDYEYESNKSPSSGDDESLSTKLDNASVINRDSGLSFEEIPRTLISKAAEKQKSKLYKEVVKIYENVKCRTEKLDDAKKKLLSYTPGSWIENAGGMDSDEYEIPKTTALLLIGPKASGKSSLINKISQVLEDDVFTSARAQVSSNQLSEDGTYFVQQYMIPRRSGSFFLFDTRALSDDTHENLKVVKRWMKKGVRHGELVKRKSDSIDLKARLKCKKHGVRSSSQQTVINFVIFVVNGLSMLEAMNGDNDMKREYCQHMAKIFNSPILSFKDDKPVLVVTHGDLLSLSDRVRTRVYLGELFGVPPTRQIFDIPDSDDSATALTIVDMLIYCLERADRNLSVKKQHDDKKLPIGKQHDDKKLPIGKQHDDKKLPIGKQHANKKLPVQKQHPDKKLPVQKGFANKIDMEKTISFFFWKVLLPMMVMLALVFLINYNHIPTKYTPRNYSFQASYTRAPTNESGENGAQASHPRAPTNQSKENSVQASRHPHAPISESHENVTRAGFNHTPTNASQRNGAHRPIDDPQEIVDEAHAPTNDASRNKDAKARCSHARTHKSKARGVKDGRQSHAATDKEEIKMEWHRIRHVWSE